MSDRPLTRKTDILWNTDSRTFIARSSTEAIQLPVSSDCHGSKVRRAVRDFLYIALGRFLAAFSIPLLISSLLTRVRLWWAD